MRKAYSKSILEGAALHPKGQTASHTILAAHRRRCWEEGRPPLRVDTRLSSAVRRHCFVYILAGSALLGLRWLASASVFVTVILYLSLIRYFFLSSLSIIIVMCCCCIAYNLFGERPPLWMVICCLTPVPVWWKSSDKTYCNFSALFDLEYVWMNLIFFFFNFILVELKSYFIFK